MVPPEYSNIIAQVYTDVYCFFAKIHEYAYQCIPFFARGVDIKKNIIGFFVIVDLKKD
jgi:hypothetical protein